MSKLMRKKKIDFDLDASAMNIFNTKIEEIYKECDTYTEAIASYCEERDIDIEEVVPLISNGLKEKMYAQELERKNIIPEDNNTIMESDIYDT